LCREEKVVGRGKEAGTTGAVRDELEAPVEAAADGKEAPTCM
jgi:hypothetical protein